MWSDAELRELLQVYGFAKFCSKTFFVCVDEISVTKLPAVPCIWYEHEILWEENFVTELRPMKSTNFLTSKILGYMGITLEIDDIIV